MLILVTPSEVKDGVPEEVEIVQAVRGLKGGRASGLSGMWAEYIKGCLQEASMEKNMVMRWWWLLVRLIQRTLGCRVLPE